MADTFPWPHAPTHQLGESGTFFVTAGTYGKRHYFRQSQRLEVLQRGLLKLCDRYGWTLEAWAMFSNHYHFVAHSPPHRADAHDLGLILKILHMRTAKWVNRLDATPARQVWHNFRETRLTFHRSYLARLSYVHQNAVKHGLVTAANQYPWCSASWFERTASGAQVRSIYKFKIDRVGVSDDFTPAAGW